MRGNSPQPRPAPVTHHRSLTTGHSAGVNSLGPGQGAASTPHIRLRSGHADPGGKPGRPGHRRADFPRVRRRPRGTRPAAAAVGPPGRRGGAGGVARAVAFPPAGLWPLAAVGPALLVIALYRQGLRASFVIGLVFGIAFFVPLLSWLVNVAWYAWAALALAEGGIFGVLAVGQRLLLRLPGWPLAVGGWWVAAEAMRARWPYAFPWGRLAMSQAAAPTAGWAASGGPPPRGLGRDRRPPSAVLPGRRDRRDAGLADPGGHARPAPPRRGGGRHRGHGRNRPGRHAAPGGRERDRAAQRDSSRRAG